MLEQKDSTITEQMKEMGVNVEDPGKSVEHMGVIVSCQRNQTFRRNNKLEDEAAMMGHVLALLQMAQNDEKEQTPDNELFRAQ